MCELPAPEDCRWEGHVDYRKPVSREEVTSLRSRIAELERQLKGTQRSSSRRSRLVASPEQGMEDPVDHALFLPDQADHPISEINTDLSSSVPAYIEVSPPRSHPKRRVTGNPLLGELETIMVQDDRGGLQFHGPTSAYHHVGAKRTEGSSEPSPGVSHWTFQTTPATQKRDFTRFLPDFPLTSEQHATVLDRFFRYFASWTQRVTPHLFHRDMQLSLTLDTEDDLPGRAPNYSPMLHNLIIAIALAYSDEPHLRSLSTRRTYLTQARSFMDRECASPCLATVQALALLSSFYSTVGEYGLGWVYFGLALRTCHALGLNVDTSSLVRRGRLNPETFRQRGVTFWTCFCQEEMWAIYIGRDPLVQEYSTPLPEVDVASDEVPWLLPDDPHQFSEPSASQPTHLSLTFVHTVSLLKLASDITKQVYALHSDKNSLVVSGAIRAFGDALDSWLEHLPPSLRISPSSPDLVLPHVLMMHLAWAWIVILLYQPFSQITSPDPSSDSPYHEVVGATSMTRSYQAAFKILQLSNMWHTQHGLRFTPPTMAQVVYTAGTTFLLAAVQARAAHQSASLMNGASQCLESLDHIAQTWPAASQKGTILSGLISEYGESSAPTSRPVSADGSPRDSVQELSGIPQPAMNALNLHPDAIAPGDTSDLQWHDPAALGDFMNIDDASTMTGWTNERESDQFLQSLLQQISMPATTELDFWTLLQSQ